MGPPWLVKVAGALFVLGVSWGWVQAADASTVASIADGIKGKKGA